jgi:putative endonuclease
LYVGVANDILRRVAEHKTKINNGFAYRYNLVYYETYNLITDAIAREKQLKNWKREWKNKLVNDFNPEWEDLSDEIGVDNEYLKAVKEGYSRLNQEIADQVRNDAVYGGG